MVVRHFNGYVKVFMVQRQLVTLAKMLGERVYWWWRLSSAVADVVVAVAAGKRRLAVFVGECRF